MTVNSEHVPNRVVFWLIWVAASSIGLGVGWPLGELLGIQVAARFDWVYGEIIGFLVCEGFIWAARLTVLSRVNNQKILGIIDIFAWVVAEVIGWFGGRSPYDPESLVGITSGSILAYHLGITTWLIVWLVKVQQPARKQINSQTQRLLKSTVRVLGSLAIIAIMVLGLPLGIELGYVAAKTFGLIIGRAVAGAIIGIVAGALTGWAILSLMKQEVWKPEFAD
jgi:hypothetical protein